LRCDHDEERREQLPQRRTGERLGDSGSALGRSSRGDPDHEGTAPTNVAVARLAPRADQRRRDDREQRRPGRIVLREPERDERRHEQDPAADAEHPRQHPGDQTEDDCEHVRHLRKSQTARARRSATKSISIVRVPRRCCRAVANPTEAAAGTPTSAAYATSTLPWNAY